MLYLHSIEEVKAALKNKKIVELYRKDSFYKFGSKYLNLDDSK